MLSTSSIDFFVDDQNRAIPASIAISYLEELPLVEQPKTVKQVVSNIELGQTKDNSQLWLTCALAGLCSTGAFLLDQSSNWNRPLSPILAAPVNQQGTGNVYYNVVKQPGLAAPAIPGNLPPETTRSATAARSSASANPTQATSAPQLLADANQIAQRATSFAQTAISIDDWGIVANQWKRAVTLLAAIPNSSAQYSVAQQRLQTYQTNLKTARQKANQPIVEAPMPTTRIQIMDGVVCRPQSSSAANNGVAVTDVKFVAEAGSNEGYLVGCFTNNTNKPVHGLNFNYRATAASQTDLVQAGNETIDIPSVAPQQTVAFRKRITLNPLITNIRMETISWLTPGATEPQTLATGIDVVR